MNQELCVERAEEPEDLDIEKKIEGNRIVQLGFVLKWAMRLQYDHSKTCTGGLLYASNEIRRGLGLVSHIVFNCTMCDVEIIKSTENPALPKSVINNGAVWGALGTGSTYGHLEEQLSCMNIPSLNKYTFYKIEKELSEVCSYAVQ